MNLYNISPLWFVRHQLLFEFVLFVVECFIKPPSTLLKVCFFSLFLFSMVLFMSHKVNFKSMKFIYKPIYIFTFMICPSLVIIWVGFVCSIMFYQGHHPYYYMYISLLCYFWVCVCVFYYYYFFLWFCLWVINLNPWNIPYKPL